MYIYYKCICMSQSLWTISRLYICIYIYIYVYVYIYIYVYIHSMALGAAPSLSALIRASNSRADLGSGGVCCILCVVCFAMC